MKKFFGKKTNGIIILDGEELVHLAVLRCEVGEKVICLTGDENEYLCEITHFSKRIAECKILEKSYCAKNPTKNITIFQGLPKVDKLELITQKVTELGASKIIPFESDFTIAKPNLNKIERLKKISIEACKQCGRSKCVEIEQPITFKQMIEKLNEYDIVLFANETNKKISKLDFKNYNNIAIIIGSEGGFSQKEIDLLKQINNVAEVGLGERILRTETASIFLCGLVSYLTEN